MYFDLLGNVRDEFGSVLAYLIHVALLDSSQGENNIWFLYGDSFCEAMIN